MAPIWSRQDGISSLFALIITTLILYGLSLAALIIVARLAVVGFRRYNTLTNEAAHRAWIIATAWLATGHLFAVYTLYDPRNTLLYTLFSALLATCGLTVGLAVVGSMVTAAVLICNRYL